MLSFESSAAISEVAFVTASRAGDCAPADELGIYEQYDAANHQAHGAGFVFSDVSPGLVLHPCRFDFAALFRLVRHSDCAVRR